MAKSQATYAKKEKEKKRLKKREEKEQRKEERKANSSGGGLENMMAYVDEFGRITDTPPNPAKKVKIDIEEIEIAIPRREKEEEPAERRGKVAFFNREKGFGFINEVGTQEKIFVHANGLLEEIAENDLVTFEMERGLKGMNAVRVKKVKA